MYSWFGLLETSAKSVWGCIYRFMLDKYTYTLDTSVSPGYQWFNLGTTELPWVPLIHSGYHRSTLGTTGPPYIPLSHPGPYLNASSISSNVLPSSDTRDSSCRKLSKSIIPDPGQTTNIYKSIIPGPGQATNIQVNYPRSWSSNQHTSQSYQILVKQPTYKSIIPEPGQATNLQVKYLRSWSENQHTSQTTKQVSNWGWTIKVWCDNVM